MKLLFSLASVVLAALLAGCAAEEEAPPPTPAQLAPMKFPNDRVLNEFYKQSGLTAPLPDGADPLMTENTANKLEKSVADLKRASDQAEDPTLVVNTAADLLAEKIKEAEARELYTFVIPLVKGYQILRPGDKLYQPYAERAQKQLNRPKVALRGLYHDHTSGTTTASVKIYDPTTRQTTTENIRMGEEFGGIKFTKIIGKDEGIELEMPATGSTFQVMKGEDLQ